MAVAVNGPGFYTLAGTLSPPGTYDVVLRGRGTSQVRPFYNAWPLSGGREHSFCAYTVLTR